MPEKTCFICKSTQPLSEFYRHPEMTDGHLNKCKTCTKKGVKENYAAKREQYSAYEQRRNQTERRQAYKYKRERQHMMRHPERAKARTMLNSGIRRGKVLKQPCQFCGDPKSQGHHHDYSKPLDVTWVCFKCHRERFHGQVVVAV